MVTQVVSFKREREDKLLQKEQKESSYDNKFSSKKKGPLAKLFQKKKKTKEPAEHAYVPPTVPSSPETPLNVTVVTGSKKEPQPSYPMNDALSTISELTYQANTPNRKVEFDPSTKPSSPTFSTPATRAETPSSGIHSASMSSRGDRESEMGSVGNDQSDYCGGSANGDDDMLTRTMSYIDGICATGASKNLDASLRSAAASPSTANSANNRSEHSGTPPVWGIIPSDDEDDDTFDTSAVDDSTYDPSQSHNSRRLSQEGRATPLHRDKHSAHDFAPTHENFEVILDASLMDAKHAAASAKESADQSKKRGWFTNKQPDATGHYPEEKKEEEVAVPRAAMAQAASKNDKSAAHLKSTSHEPETEEPKPKNSLARRLSKAITGQSSKNSSSKTETSSKEISGSAGRNKKVDESWRQTKTNNEQSLRIIKEIPVPKIDAVSARKPAASTAATANTGTAVAKAATTKQAPPAQKAPVTVAVNTKKSLKPPPQPVKPEAKAKVAETNKSPKVASPSVAAAAKPAKEKSRGRSKGSAGKSEKSGKGKRNKSWGAFSRFNFMAKRKAAKDDSEVQYDGKANTSSDSQKAPKSMWKAVADPNTNKTYYYHRKTRETTWIKPKELIEFEKKIAADSVANHDAAVKSAKSQDGSTSTKAAAAAAATSTSSATRKPAPRLTQSESPTRQTGNSSTGLPTRVQSNSSSQGGGNTSIATDQPDAGSHLASQISAATTASSSRAHDDTWEKKKEVTRLLAAIPKSSKEDADAMMRDHPADVELQLKFLRDLLEAKPFDEPEVNAPMDEPRFTFSVSPPRDANPMTKRVITGFSRASATTKSSVKTEKTQKIKNTWRGSKESIGPIAELRTSGTSISSDRDNMLPPISNTEPIPNNSRIPSKVPVVRRKRELHVEDLSDTRLASETFGKNGRVLRGRGSNGEDDDDSQDDLTSYYQSEADTYGDSVSALSETDQDFAGRKDNFESARRRALEDAIERADWDLAGALTEGMRNVETTGDNTQAHGTWRQSEIDKFIAQNNWDAVSTYIAQMRNKGTFNGVAKAIDQGIAGEQGTGIARSPSANAQPAQASAVVKAPSRLREQQQLLLQEQQLQQQQQLLLQQQQQQQQQLAQQQQQLQLAQPEARLEKRIGSRSQLQHREITSDSSWTSEDSYDTYDSDFS